MDAQARKKPLAVYVHFPFCRAKCAYCDFTSFSGKGGLIPEYLSVLKEEISLNSNLYSEHEVKSVFFGGGTPTVLESKDLTEILRILREKYNFSKTVEISIEANPETVTLKSLTELRRGGFNRISFGVQSFSDRDRKSTRLNSSH